MTHYVRIHEDGKRDVLLNPAQVCYIIDIGDVCEVVMSCGGNRDAGLPGSIRVSMPAEELLGRLLFPWSCDIGHSSATL